MHILFWGVYLFHLTCRSPRKVLISLAFWDSWSTVELRSSNVILLVKELPHELLRVDGVLVQQHS
jgi:hypothetical protein